MVEVLHSGYTVPFHHLPPVLWEPLEFPSIHLGICQGSGTSGSSGENAAERHLGTDVPSGSEFSQLAVSSTEGIGEGGGVTSIDRLLESEHKHHPYQIQNEDGLLEVGGNREGRLQSTSKMPTFRYPFIQTLNLSLDQTLRPGLPV